ncbi:coiled-coil domain-containing protein 170 [Chrysoperla carnea]|uniref:coiled-coil domain-containing protein 170 n=1 Tax=Chrysoperla carnea TaxID=189513 RepID=UPI001D06C9E8|nr:coiled-coil domain-containing protein 170 [Chrysoperla carnea]
MAEEQPPPSPGNSDEDWKIFEALCITPAKEMDAVDTDVTTTLKSEIAALQYKRDRLSTELDDMKGQVRQREQRVMELQIEADGLREQSARQSAIISSLKKKIQDLEEHERDLHAIQGRQEISFSTLQRECRYNEDKVKEMEKKLRALEMELSSETQMKDAARNQLNDLLRRLASALGTDFCETGHGHGLSPEAVVHKAAELVQETARLRNRSSNMNDTLASVEIELRSCREALERAQNDKENLQRQCAAHLSEVDRLRQEKECLEMHQRVMERELNDLREKVSIATRSLGSASTNIAQHESTICQLREDLKSREEKCKHLHHEIRHLIEALAGIISSSGRYVEATDASIKDRLREILNENKDKTAHIESLKEKLCVENQQINRQMVVQEQAAARIRALEEEKNCLESRLMKAENEIKTLEISREGLRRDKNTFMSFLERLGRALNMDEISQEIGVDLHTESLLVRAEQLSRQESDKLVDKLLCCGYYGHLPRIRRERSYPDLRETSVVYQLQRRVRTLREQVQRKDLHLDLLRRKLSLQEDNLKVKCLLQTERDEANIRAKKLQKQVDRLQLQLTDAKAQIRDLNSQLAEAADYKITALERARKIDELQKRLVESEMLRTRYNRKVAVLKDQVRTTTETSDQQRSMTEHTIQVLRDDLARIKDELNDCSRREGQLQNFKTSIAKILGCTPALPDFEIISRLQKLVDAHHDFTLVSRRYDDPILRLTSRSPTGGSRCTRTPDRSLRYDDSGYADAPELDFMDDDLYKRPIRPSI